MSTQLVSAAAGTASNPWKTLQGCAWDTRYLQDATEQKTCAANLTGTVEGAP